MPNTETAAKTPAADTSAKTAAPEEVKAASTKKPTKEEFNSAYTKLGEIDDHIERLKVERKDHLAVMRRYMGRSS